MPELSEAQFERLATKYPCKPVMSKNGDPTGEVLTCVARLQFVDMPDEKGKYKCVLIFHPSADISALKDSAIGAAFEKWGEKYKTLLKADRTPLKNQGKMAEKFDGFYERGVFLNCQSMFAPRVYAMDAVSEIKLDADTIYNGAYVRATLKPFTYEPDKSKNAFDYGVSFGLQGFQFVADGKRLGGGVPMSDYLQPIALEDDDEPRPESTNTNAGNRMTADLF